MKTFRYVLWVLYHGTLLIALANVVLAMHITDPMLLLWVIVLGTSYIDLSMVITLDAIERSR